MFQARGVRARATQRPRLHIPRGHTSPAATQRPRLHNARGYTTPQLPGGQLLTGARLLRVVAAGAL
eukprot:421051-Prymnesium_polylepis.1